MHMSDVHLNNRNKDLLLKQFNDEFFDRIDEIVELSKNENSIFGGLCIEGDFFDTKLELSSQAVYYAQLIMKMLVKKVIIENNAKIIILRGTYSHDYNQVEHLFLPYSLAYPDHFHIVNEPKEFTIEGYKVLAIPEEYYPEDQDPYKEFFNNHYDLFLMHGFFSYNKFNFGKDDVERSMPNMYIFDAERVMKMADVTICGHDHHYHDYKGKIWYNGSFSRNSLGEFENKGHLLTVHYPDKEPEVLFLENTVVPKYGTVKLSHMLGEENIDINEWGSLKPDELFTKISSLITKYYQGNNYHVLRVRLDTPMDDFIKVSLNQHFRGSVFNIVLEFQWVEEKKTIKTGVDIFDSDDDMAERDTSNDYLFDDGITFEEKLKMFIQKNGDLDISIDDIRHFLTRKPD